VTDRLAALESRWTALADQLMPGRADLVPGRVEEELITRSMPFAAPYPSTGGARMFADRARSVVGEHPGDLNDTGTDAGSVLNAELAGSAPPQADGIVR
jgi:hypothetical protein